MQVYVEIGAKRAIANAVEWYGWARGGRDESSAVETLLAYAPRYAQAMAGTHLDFRPPSSLSALKVVTRLPGDAGTEFGAVSVPFPGDARPLSTAELARCQAIIEACWRALDGTAAAAAGRELRKGPRGGGREVDEIVRHVAEAERSYLSRIGRKAPAVDTPDLAALQAVTRQAVLDGLVSAVRDGVEPYGPRGGRRWSPREFVRHVAWHALDHAWEIEDRVT